MTRALIDENLDQDRVTRRASATLGWQVSRFIVALILVAAVGYLGFRLSDPTPVPPDSAQKPLSPAEVQANQGLTIEFDNPLGPGGQEVPVQTATALIRKYLTAELALTGPASIDHVTAAWIDATGQVALELDSGILFIYSPDTRTSDQWAEGAAEAIQLGGWEGTMMQLRGVMGRAGEKTEEWSASIAWLEGKALVEMYGDGGQQLEELIPLRRT